MHPVSLMHGKESPELNVYKTDVDPSVFDVAPSSKITCY